LLRTPLAGLLLIVAGFVAAVVWLL